MSQDQVKELWRLEEQFWLAGADFYERTLFRCALMVLPDPAGIIDRAATIDSIRAAVRWQNVRFKDQHQVLLATDAAVLAYSVRADRGSSDTSYVARCSSTYVRDNGQWLLLLHHHSGALASWRPRLTIHSSRTCFVPAKGSTKKRATFCLHHEGRLTVTPSAVPFG